MDRETETERERDCSEWTERLRQREREGERGTAVNGQRD